MIWAAFFLICSQEDCLAVGSPLFETKKDCEYAAVNYGIWLIRDRFPNHVVLNFKCVSFGEVDT